MRAASWLRLTGAVVAGLMVLTASPGAATAAAPRSKVVCSGFLQCTLAGRGNLGYELAYLLSFWNMTPGHNCTNYLAYRLSHGGRMVARPPGTAGAATWGPAARDAGVPVDDVPAVGAVAWWGAGVFPAGPSGHVAIVEKVYPDGSIEVSEDNLTGDFRWRLVVRGDGWPSGFIHYPDSDGSPFGRFLSVTSPGVGQVDLWGTSSDPDSPEGVAQNYLVTVGGPRQQAGVESLTFSSPYFRFHRIASVRSRGTTTLYLYALNRQGTAGSDTLLGTQRVTIRSASAVRAKLADGTIKKSVKPKIRVGLGRGQAGTVEVLRGSRVLKRFSVAAGAVRTVALPRQKKGKHVLRVRYRGSAAFASSYRDIVLRVR